MKYLTNQFKAGLKVLIENEPCSILSYEFHKPGKGQAKSIPVTFDWRNQNGNNFVSPVKDLTVSNSCYNGYTFVAIAACESRFKIDDVAGRFTGTRSWTTTDGFLIFSE